MNENIQIVKYAQGVKLINAAQSNGTASIDSGYTMADIFELPMCVHLTDNDHQLRYLNDTTAAECGFLSMKDAIGRSLLDVSEKESALRVNRNCHEVMQTRYGKIFEEKVIRNDERFIHSLSVKLPWYDENNKIVGVFGFSSVIGKQSLDTLFSKIVEMNVLHPTTLNQYQLSKRQEECLHYLVAGHTSKEIASLMNLSVRTVEHYIDAVRIKMQCRSRLELVKKAMVMSKSSGYQNA